MTQCIIIITLGHGNECHHVAYGHNDSLPLYLNRNYFCLSLSSDDDIHYLIYYCWISLIFNICIVDRHKFSNLKSSNDNKQIGKHYHCLRVLGKNISVSYHSNHTLIKIDYSLGFSQQIPSIKKRVYTITNSSCTSCTLCSGEVMTLQQ